MFENSEQQNLLGKLIDSKLNFETGIDNLCRKAIQNLTRYSVSSYWSANKKRLIMKPFVAIAQLSYCPLMWMNHSRKLSNEIDGMHERALRVLHSNKFTCKKLFIVNKSVRIHSRNLQILLTEISTITIYYVWRFPNGRSLLCNYDLSNKGQFKFRNPKRVHNIKKVHCITGRIPVLRAKLWMILGDEYKNLNNARDF